MPNSPSQTVCWTPVWNKKREGIGLEHLLLGDRVADSVVLAFDEEHGPFRLTYHLTWDSSWRVHNAQLVIAREGLSRSLNLQSDGQGHWNHGDGRAIEELNGCRDIDIWPTPFTSFPIRREPSLSASGSSSAWLFALERLYLFENLDGSGFQAELPVDEDGIVVDYPDLFTRVKVVHD